MSESLKRKGLRGARGASEKNPSTEAKQHAEAELVPLFMGAHKKRPLLLSGLFGKYNLCLKRWLFVEHFVSRIKGGWCIIVARAST